MGWGICGGRLGEPKQVLAKLANRRGNCAERRRKGAAAFPFGTRKARAPAFPNGWATIDQLGARHREAIRGPAEAAARAGPPPPSVQLSRNGR